MRITQIRNFVAAARAGSLRGAARQLDVAQPALSRSIQELEIDLGVQLFVREARGVYLTAAGERLLPRASAILRDLQRTRDEISQISGEGTGELIVGLSIAGHMGLLGNVLEPFSRRWPGVRVRLIEGFLPTLAADIQAGNVDLYIGPVLDPSPYPLLSFEKLFDNERLVVGRADHPLTGARTLADLTGATWLTTSITREAEDELDTLFLERGLPKPHLAFQCQSALSILTVISATDVLAMLPRQWVEGALTMGRIAPLPLIERFAAPPINLVQKAGLGLTPAAETFTALVRRSRAPKIRAG